MSLQTIIRTIRPPFLLLTLSCCLLAFSMAVRQHPDLEQWLMLPVFLAALFAHISVNVLNEYQDFHSGLDLNTERTPFSGGSGALVENPEAGRAVGWLAVLSLLITVLLGLFLLLSRGTVLLVPGLLGIVLVIAYTRWINRMPWLCLFAPGIGFGLIMVTGSYVALTGVVDLKAVWVSMLPLFLVNNLLLLNQYPDIRPDQQAGRRHFPIRYGIELSNRMYLLFLVAAFSVIPCLILMQQLSSFGWIVMLLLPLGVYAWSGAQKFGADIGRHPSYLAANVALTLLAPVVLSLVIYLDK